MSEPTSDRPCGKRIVVLGATPAGLAVAMRLAAKRHTVTVIDDAGEPGGPIARRALDGLLFDTGELTLPAVFRDLFVKTGGALEDEIDLQPVDLAREYRFADGSSMRLPGAGVGAAAHAVGAAFGDDAQRQWTTFMTAAADAWTTSRQEAWHAKSTDEIAAGTTSAPAVIGRGEAMDDVITTHLRDPRLLAIAREHASTLGTDARFAPAVLIARPYVELAFGMWHVGGGRGRLADALVRRARERGVDVRLDTHVDTSALDADLVVPASASAPLYAQSFTDDPAVVPPHMRKRLLGGPQDVHRGARFTILAAIDGPAPDAHLTTWFGPDLHARDWQDGRLPAEPTVTVCAPPDPAMAADGHTPWAVSVTVPRHGDGASGTVDWTSPGRADAYAEHVLDRLAARGADLRPRIRALRVDPPRD